MISPRVIHYQCDGNTRFTYFRTGPNNSQWVICSLLGKLYYTFNTFIPVQIIPTNLFIRSLKKSYYTFNIFISVQIIPTKLFMRFLKKSYYTFNAFIPFQIIPTNSFMRMYWRRWPTGNYLGLYESTSSGVYNRASTSHENAPRSVGRFDSSWESWWGDDPRV